VRVAGEKYDVRSETKNLMATESTEEHGKIKNTNG
jgi:hypothetical protein